MPSIWIFHGSGAQFASGVFSTRERAKAWIEMHNLAGTLTEYPIDIGVFEHAIAQRWFTPKNDQQRSSQFIQRFSSANQEHEHYELD